MPVNPSASLAPSATVDPDGQAKLSDRPDSPCIGICSTLFDEICQGCGRTAAEVSNWVFYSDEEKQVIWERITREGTARRFQPD
ncbi:DUF1289 domain-containing protein [Cupriavidus metallidurans]|uniref:DUF1289 domain-containing protein n=1 Tax=Cupriavidus metallidurans (strain ATCC 43123 / DSM 2839 / NBRC 102507 / CH34) TaxID=266264 RepID=Q1LN12_CUPMC|nr:DUF1289 domain-containing protein [Cupriavidus metallidurans]ABF08464.1 conserved hypothetical protein; predicted Fe-S protein [Cupriavidus metallidurans CH34]QGS30575.1 DUF1289 domain-containing protein [Cupriavidus metallidurans]